MLLINGIMAIIGMVIAFVIYQLQTWNALSILPLIGLCGIGLFIFICINDVLSDWLVKKFNPSNGLPDLDEEL